MPARYSHPAEGDRPPVPLKRHLDDVAKRVRIVAPDEKTTPFGSSLQETVSSLAWVHDFGKLTTWFQAHLVDERPTGPTHHSPIGALLAYHVLESGGRDPEECLAGYVAVATHHGTLPNVAEYVFERSNWDAHEKAGNYRKKEILEQVDDIEESVSDLAEEIIEEASGGETTWDDFVEETRSKALFDRVKSRVSTSGFNHDTYNISPEFYPCVLQCWSGLVLADKTSAANAPTSGFEHECPSREVLAAYIDGLSTGNGDSQSQQAELNRHRRRAREDVLRNAREMVSNDERVATITLPTGMGKTLTGLDAALTIRDETDRRRVVYALPFTSIIDQVVDEVGEIFGTDGSGNLLTVHHHLAETSAEPDEGLDLDEGSDKHARIVEMFGESWRSGTVVTTFVQLFESLAGPRNAQSMKLPALYDSVVILDEPQAIPHSWWPLVNRLIDILESEFDAAVIAMTATQPQLFERDVTSLVDDPQSYFEAAERSVYEIEESLDAFPDSESGPLEYHEAATTLVDSGDHTDDVLAVCNTIDSAIALTEAVQEQTPYIDAGRTLERLYDDEPDVDVSGSMLADRIESRAGDVALFHLSTRVRPRDRLVLINTIKELTGREVPTYVISTQLIEAGVDVSFDRVFRDFAPMDSIVQAAGRCNRSFERDRGIVTLWWLDAPEDQKWTPGQAVYDVWGESLLRVTSQVLDSIRSDEDSRIDEPLVAWEGVREYYRRLTDEKRVGNRQYVEYVDSGEIRELGELSLIEQRQAVEVIVCRTAEERDDIEKIRDAWGRYDFTTMKSLLRELRSSQVSIPIYSSDSEEAQALADLERVHTETDIRWVDTSQPEYDDFFDPVTGFVVPDSTVERRFL